VKEQSHKDEMSAALRGDFARLRDRGVAATLAPRDDEPPEPAVADSIDQEPREAVPDREPETPSEGQEPVAQPGFLARMLGR
jgi:hypothetical protein